MGNMWPSVSYLKGPCFCSLLLLTICATAGAQPASSAVPVSARPSQAPGNDGSGTPAPTSFANQPSPPASRAEPAPIQAPQDPNGAGQQPAYAAPQTTPSETYLYPPNNADDGGQRTGAQADGTYGATEDTSSASSFEWPTMSVRVDPLNWLLWGRLGVELESQIWKFVSVELVPVFVVNDQPPYLNLNLSGVPNTLYQKSGGWGSLAGASLGVGFWFDGKPMEGYVLRAELTDYVFDYDSRDENGPIDHVRYVDREFQVLLGSHSKWGPVTLAGTFGLGTMLNRQNRCFLSNGTAATSGCTNSKELSIAATKQPLNVVNLHDWTYPAVLVFRISLGVVF